MYIYLQDESEHICIHFLTLELPFKVFVEMESRYSASWNKNLRLLSEVSRVANFIANFALLK